MTHRRPVMSDSYRLVHRLGHYRVYRALRIIVSVALLFLTFFEEPRYEDYTNEGLAQRRVVRGIECVLCIFLLAATLQILASIGKKVFFHQFWHCAALLINILLLCEAILAFSIDYALRPFRLLRPFLVIYFSTRVRRLSSSAMRTLPYVADVMVLSVFVVICFALLGAQLFGNLDSYTDGAGEPCKMGSFRTFGEAMVSLFVLATTENFPAIMYPSFELSRWSALYFVIFVLVVIFVLSATLVAVTFNVFMEGYTRAVLRRRMRERRSLLLAFKALDFYNDGFLYYEEFAKFWVRIHRPSWIRLQLERCLPFMRSSWNDEDATTVRLAFKALDGDDTNKLDVFEFLHLPDVLQLAFKIEAISVEEKSGSALSRFRERLSKVINSKPFMLIVIALILANTVVLCMFYYCQPEEEERILLLIDDVLLYTFAVEIFVRIFALGPIAYFTNVWSAGDALAVYGSIVLSFVFPAERSSLTVAARLLRLTRVFRPLRLVAIADRFRVISATIVAMLPFLASFSMLLINIIYGYAVLGMELFGGGQLPALACNDTVDSVPPAPFVECDEIRMMSLAPLTTTMAMREAYLPTDQAVCAPTFCYGNPTANFDTFPHAILSLFQIVTTSNWHEIMYAAMAATNHFASWYFTSFFFLVSIFLVNVLIALMLETFSVQREMFMNKSQMEFEFDEDDDNVDEELHEFDDLPDAPDAPDGSATSASATHASERAHRSVSEHSETFDSLANSSELGGAERRRSSRRPSREPSRAMSRDGSARALSADVSPRLNVPYYKPRSKRSPHTSPRSPPPPVRNMYGTSASSGSRRRVRIERVAKVKLSAVADSSRIAGDDAEWRELGELTGDHTLLEKLQSRRLQMPTHKTMHSAVMQLMRKETLGKSTDEDRDPRKSDSVRGTGAVEEQKLEELQLDKILKSTPVRRNTDNTRNRKKRKSVKEDKEKETEKERVKEKKKDRK